MSGCYGVEGEETEPLVLAFRAVDDATCGCLEMWSGPTTPSLEECLATTDHVGDEGVQCLERWSTNDDPEAQRIVQCAIELLAAQEACLDDGSCGPSCSFNPSHAIATDEQTRAVYDRCFASEPTTMELWDCIWR